MKRLLLLSAIVATALAIGACSSDDDTTIATVTLPSGGDLSGTWATSCITDFSTFAGARSITFSGTSFTFDFDEWLSDFTCTAGASDISEDGTVTFALNGTKTVSGTTVSKVDITVTAVTATANTTAGKAELESRNGGAGAYGVSTWTVGSPVDVLGINDDGSAGTNTFKDIWSVDTSVTPNTASSRLEVDDGGTVDANGYPNELDPNLVLVKQ